MVVVDCVTSLEGVTPRTPFPRAVLPDRRSFREGKPSRFRSPETRSWLLPTERRCSLFGTVSQSTYRQALCGPFMVELFTAGISPGPRAWSMLGTASHEARGSPRRQRLNEPDGPFTRVGDSTVALVRTPSGGFCRARARHHHFNHHGLRRESLHGDRFFPVALFPIRGEPAPSDRTSGLLRDWNATGLRRRASVEPDKRVSTHPALRVSTSDGW